MMDKLLEILGELGSYAVVFGPTIVSLVGIIVTIIKCFKSTKSLREAVEKIVSTEQNEYKDAIMDLTNKLSEMSMENLEIKQLLSLEKKAQLKIALTSEEEKNVTQKDK